MQKKGYHREKGKNQMKGTNNRDALTIFKNGQALSG